MMEIVKCKGSDLDRTAKFYDEVVIYLDENNINYPQWKYNIYPSRSSVQKAIENKGQYICIENGEVIGGFILNEDPQGAYEKGEWQKNLLPGEFLVIHTLATKGGHYNKGIGKAMIEFCISYGKENGYKGIRLDAVPDNLPARRLYEKLGFTFAGDKNLERYDQNIPLFSLFELNF